MNTIIERGISGGMLWSLRFHNRDGGFYWHSEPSGENLFKAYHWPGFATGEAYDERQILQLTQKMAYKIRGMDVPSPTHPLPPKLLPIENTSEISWQGTSGASSYDIQRSESSDGPLANCLAKMFRMQPFNIDRYSTIIVASIGKKYFYRVVAKNNVGASPPSNVIGPVNVHWQTMVDECRNFENLSQHSDNIQILSRKARKSQEDVHRFLLSSGSSLHYHLDGPIKDWHLFLFVVDENVNIKVLYSVDGKKFLPCHSERLNITVGSGDYGYSRPLLLKGTVNQPEAQYLQIQVDHETTQQEKEFSIELSRVEITHGKSINSSTRKSNKPRYNNTPRQGAQLNPSILMFHKPHHTQGIKYVQRAAELGSHHVNVVVTLLCNINKQHQIISYGVIKNGKYVPLNEELLTEFRNSLQEVFSEVAAQNMELSVLAHLNAGGKIYEWRNNFLFDPLAKYNGYSYQETLINTIADTLATTIKPRAVRQLCACRRNGSKRVFLP